MTDVIALEQRITIALDRIGNGLGRLGQASQEPAAADPDEVAALQAALDGERVANAQLEERVKALKDRQDGKISDLERRIESYIGQMSKLDAELQRLRTSNADMREVSAQLRSAATDGVAQPELINRALMAEVEALSAQRSADAAEADAIIADLKPLIEEA